MRHGLQLTVAVLLMAGVASAYEVEYNADTWSTNGVSVGGYESNIPSEWTYKNSIKTFTILPDRTGFNGISAIKFNSQNIAKNHTAELKMGTNISVPKDQIVCDNVLGKLTLYVFPSDPNRTVDKFELIASTNDWSGDFTIGEAIPIRSDEYKEGWKTFAVRSTIAGISKTDGYEALRIGVRMTTGGYSQTYGYIHGLSIDFKACATPATPELVDNSGSPLASVLEPGLERGRIKVNLSVVPEDKIEGLRVYGVLSRNNGSGSETTTNLLEEVDGVYYERLEDVEKRSPFDAGEVISCSAFTKYQSNDPSIAPLGEIDEDGYATETSPVASYNVGKCGSAWVNEIGFDGADCFVEVCGTTNRTYLSGWVVVLSGTNGELPVTFTNVFDGVFDFAAHMENGFNGTVGSIVKKIDLGEVHLAGATLELINSAGVVEFSAQNLTLPGHYQMTGVAKWNETLGYGYDWTGTGIEKDSKYGPFTFSGSTDDKLTLGFVNAGQGFIVPIKTTLYFTTLIGETGAPLSFASVNAQVDGIKNGEAGTMDFPGETAEGSGTAQIGINGFSADASNVPLTCSVSAFGWKAQGDKIVTNVSLYADVYLTNKVVSTVAYDDFSKLNAYWTNASTIRNNSSKVMYWEMSDGTLRLDTRNGTKGNATLTTKSYADLRGKRCLDVSFDFKNERDYGISDSATLTVQLSDSPNFPEGFLETEGVANKSDKYGEGVWYSFRQFIALPDEFAADGKMWIRIKAVKNVTAPNVYTTLDNLRVASLDAVKIKSLDLTEPMSGAKLPLELPADVQLGISPLAGIVSNFVDEVLVSIETGRVQKVSADLMLKINDTEFAVPFSFADGSLTNDISAAEKIVKLTISPSTVTEITGGFLPGDKVEYYARVSYDPDDADDSGDRDVRYFPDNATATENGWYAKGNKDKPKTAYLHGSVSFDVTGPALSVYGTPEITADRITVNYNAWDEKGIASLNFEVTTNGVPVQTEPLTTNGVDRVMGVFSATNLVANTEYVLWLSGVNNKDGGALAPTNYTFVTRPVLTRATIVGISPSTAKLTASGQAAGFVVTPSDWVQESDSVQGDVRTTTWTRGEGTPNSQMSATVYATNKVGLASMATNSPSGFTLAAVATKAPVIQKGTVTVVVGADEGYAAGNDGNPEGTEYAVRVTTSDGGDVLVKTNGVEVWKTLADWRAESVTVEKPTIDLLSTNYFSFITRNCDKTVSPNESPVTTNCWFDMTAEVAGAEQTATFGKVDVALKFSDPAQSDDARAEVEYKIVGQGDWTPVESFDVPFDEIEMATNITWNAWTAVKETEGTYEYLLRAKVTDAAHGRSSGWVEMAEAGTLDFVKPTVTLKCDTTPDPFNQKKSPMVVEVKFSKSVTGFTKDSLSIGNGTAVMTGADDTYTVSVTPKTDGVVTVQVLAAGKAKDRFGNTNKASDVLSRTYDTKAPEIQPIEGEPGEMVVTNGNDFAFTVSATDESTPLKYHWTTNGVQVADNETSELKGKDAREGTNVVTVCAEDTAGNSSTNVIRTWVVDTIAPTEPEIDGKPDKFTNVPAFTMTASSVDATRLTYHWTFNDADFTGATLAKTAREGENAVRVYATDEAGNVSPTNSYSWTLDTLKPTDLKIDGDPQEGVVTNGTEFAFTASASDATQLTFHWTTNGVPVADYTAAELSGAAIEGTNTVSVYAKDAAGNACDPTNRTWVVDTIAPTMPEISGKPAALTNEVAFSMTASSVDATRLTYHWTFNDEDFTGATLAKTAREGENAVRVYATDEAGNVSPTNFWNWVVDTQPPTDPVITGIPEKGSITNGKAYNLTAASTDEHLITYHWTLGARKAAVTNFVGTAEDGDGTYTASVYATDAAGNVSGTTTWTWTLDTTAPTVPVISGTPANGSVTNEPNFSLTAEATDATLITYHWLTNGVAAADVTNLVGRVDEEGLFEVKCYATDAAGNVSETNDWSWTFDRTAPTKPVITDNLKKGAITNVEAYDLTAASTDEHLITYHWTLGEKKETVTNFVGSVTSSGEYTDFTAFVYATDEAGNVSETSSISWRLDTKHPTVQLTSTASGHFNRKAAPMEVTATFSEEVTNFTYKCVTVQTGTVSNEIETVEEKKVFKFWVYPEHYGVPTFIDEETVSVSIDENKVWDYAGNGNEASLNEQGQQAPLTRVYDTKSPIVTLSSETPDNFNASYAPLKVTIGVTGKGVTELLPESIVITNGVVKKFEKTDEKQGDDGAITERTYALEVTPTKEALITVVVPESVLTNMTGNTNPASEPPVLKTYDNTAPQNLAINGEPSQNKVTAATTFDFEATADDLTAMKFHWALNGVEVTDNETSAYSGTVEKGTNWVTVSATDAAGNTCAEVKRTWVVDFEPPENLTLSGTPGEMGKTNVTSETSFTYTASATDDTQIKYHWLTNGVEVVDDLSTELVGTAIEGTNTVSVYATDEADNVSVTNTILWVVDTIDPTVPSLSGEPADKTITQQTGFSYTAESEDATVLTYTWKLDGGDETEKDAGAAFSGSGLADGGHTVEVYATDEAGNKSEATNWTWTVDTTKPTNLKVWGLPISDEKIVVTNGNDFAFEASATDATALKFHWMTNGVAVTDITASSFVGQVGEGTNTVSVYAEDAAGNVCDSIARTWVVDTIAPTVPSLEGAPADKSVTKEQGYSYTAESEDATILTYTWKLDGGDETEKVAGAAFAGSGLADGVHQVIVYAKDEAGNVSATTNWTWTVDTTKPTNLKVWGLPISDEKIIVTNGFDFAFEASATDATALTYHWATNGVDVTGITSFNFVGQVSEGTNTVSVYAEDAAGNVCDPIARTWVVDTIEPTVPVIEGEPADGAITQQTDYSYTATSEDATIVTYYWALNGGDEVAKNAGEAFAGSGLADGGHQVIVYATDEAGNKSAATNWTWTVDTTKPTDLKLWGLPISDEKVVVTNGFDFAFEASATDATALKFHWMTNGVAVTDITSSSFVGQVGEGTNTVSVYAEDAAGNVCDPIARTWVVDTIAPTVPVITGEPADKTITNAQGYSYTAESEDATVLTYTWKLDGGDETEKDAGAAFAGSGLADGGHTVEVYATDEAGNKSEATNWTWTVDTTKPTNLKVWGLPISEDPEVIVLTNGCDFAFEASATDATALKFIWATNGITATGCTASNFVGQVSEGTNTITVYAKDAAGNVCDPIERKWVVDLTPPTVELSTETSEDVVFNRDHVFKVTVAFSEDVEGFAQGSASVDNGTVTAVVTNSAASYTVTVTPAHDGPVSVWVEADAVTDLAGNGNVASEQLTRTCDITPPVVTLESSTPDPFNSEVDPLTVTVTFSESVTNFTAASIAVENGTPGEPVKQESLDGISEVYEVEVMPTADGKVTVSIAAGVVADAAGNPNAASENPLTRIHDTTPPTKPVISGTPADGATVKTFAFSFTAASTDATSGIDHYVWVLNDDEDDPFVTEENTLTEDTLSWYDEVKAKGKLVEGLNTVKVYAVDGTFWNLSDDSEEWVWTIEPEPSENVEFGDGVFLRVDPDTGATNAVSFTMVDFHPGETSTFTLSGFEVEPPQKTGIDHLRMRFIVCDTLTGTRWYAEVDEKASYEAGALTVTIPGKATKDIEPYESFFIFGIDNKGSDK